MFVTNTQQLANLQIFLQCYPVYIGIEQYLEAYPFNDHVVIKSEMFIQLGQKSDICERYNLNLKLS